MKILIALDEPAFRKQLEETLVKWGHKVIATKDGDEAWNILRGDDAPQLVILNWVMPGMDGVEICRKVREKLHEPFTFIILLTTKKREEELVTGMEAGADDYIIKPFKAPELKVRIEAGMRIIELQNQLSSRVVELEAANRDLEGFSYALANQVVKSLMTIAENAEIISSQHSGKEHEECRRHTRRIYDKTKLLGELIGTMYEYFSLSKRVLHRERINLSEIAAKTAEEHKKARPGRPITFKITRGIETNGDKDLLRKVLGNLFENSLAHTTKSEEAVIEFGIRKEVDGKETYFVHDNGEGFNMADRKDLFIPFQHLPKAGEFRGFGVGLATVEKIIRRHGGRAWAEGGPDEGATIYFTLSS